VLPCIHDTIEKDYDDTALLDDDNNENEVVGKEVANDIEATYDENPRELVDVMEREICPGNDSVDEGKLDSPDDEDHDKEEDNEDSYESAGILSAHSGNVDNALEGNDDMTRGTKRRVEALNEEADEVDWRREDGGYFEHQARPRATRARTKNGLDGRQVRGIGRGREARECDLSHPLDPPELSAFEIERQHNKASSYDIHMHQF